MKVRVTEQLLEQGRSARGGYSKRQLELIGVAWPPLSGWKRLVLGREIEVDAAREFVSLGAKRWGQPMA